MLRIFDEIRGRPMSWDLRVGIFPPQVRSVADIPRDFRPTSIGKRSEIISSIRKDAPTANFPDPSWGLISYQDWSIEVSLGAEEECTSFGLGIRGGDAALGVVVAILRRLNLRAIDCQTSEFFVSGKEALESFQRWKAYLDTVLASHSPDKTDE
jgi:hypothetical protein